MYRWYSLLSQCFFCVTRYVLLIALPKPADNFGRGQDAPGFRPHGAREVRKAARAFIVMKERISRQVRTRTEMLASISHDLRTPLTRMKLQLAMLEDNDATRELRDDVQQMEHMIQEYLDFVRGEGGEEAAQVALDELVSDVVEDYRRLKVDVVLKEVASRYHRHSRERIPPHDAQSH